MRKTFSLIILTSVLLSLFVHSSSAAESDFIPTPQTPYAQQFVDACQGEQWFLQEIERLLNQNQKSINTINSSDDLAIIKSLGFAGQGIRGRIPAAIGELTELKHLFAAGNNLSGVLPDGFFLLPALQTVDLSNNSYTGLIPDGFGRMTALRSLILQGNSYTGGIPTSILSNTGITVLDVSSNELTGGFPTEINGMTALQYLAVSDNRLGGAMPELTGLTNLKALSAWNCALTGVLPDSLYTRTELQILDLAGNGLTGQISTSIGGLTELQLLALGGNELTGSIPAEIANLTALATLDLSSNKLDGTVPDAFGDMDELMEIHLEENNLRGLLPDSIDTRLTAGAVVYARDNYLTGTVLAKVADNARNFCDGAATEQYRMTLPSSLTINESTKINVWPMLQNRNLRTGDTWLKPLLPIACYTAELENDPTTKVELTQDGNGFYVKVVPLPPPVNPTERPKTQEILPAENIRLTLRLTDNTGSEYSKVSILLTTQVPSISGGGGGGGASAPTPSETHQPYVDGYPDGRFGPGDSVTREQAAKLVISALGAELPERSYSKFDDVAATRWSAPYIEYARKRGYLMGTGDGNFTPEAQMTRAEFTVMLARVWGNREQDGHAATGFPDVPETAWYREEVANASAMGLIQGLPDGKFHPLAPISRAESVTIINRLLGRDALSAVDWDAQGSPFDDMTRAHWAYLDVVEASVEHQHVQTGEKRT